ncbi:UDP-4-amino-4,6-dideoxy-N-acetyl-beta-L-altrosamine transaminase [Gallaecimonas sp. GXIMD4217]|uniref:UDP-4-amino-4, 6-dideoxy-N-acetyl-beta-L-altrosamine transaminase n=1 Tax=Gallaecimonas sp. GXIMD4217 TaxID=3131927 RepID=UPI00311B3C5D
MIPYGRQCLDQDDIQAVVEVLSSDFLTQGPAVPEFERAVARYCGAAHAVACSSATSALHLACLALGLGQGDRLWTSAISFVASANCGRYCGAEVDFVDVDPRSGNISVQALADKLADAERDGTLPKVLVAVHLAGQSCDMAAIAELASRYGFRVIEDASHALGGRHAGQPIGNCRHSDITVFSFHPVKPITAGEGGMAVTQDETLAGRMALLRSHGISREPQQMTAEPDGPWAYAQVELGFNYRLSDLHAALGLSQLAKLDAFSERRRQLAARYDAALPAPWRPLAIAEPADCAYHLYVAQRPVADLTEKRRIYDGLCRAGVQSNVHYIPIPSQPYYQALGQDMNRYPGAWRYYLDSFTLPLFVTLGDQQQRQVLDALEQ